MLAKRRAAESAISVFLSVYLTAGLGLVATLLAFLPTPDIPFPIPFRGVLVAAGFMAMFPGRRLLTLGERKDQ